MPPTNPGITMPRADEQIEWLGDSTPDLSEREQLLVTNAYREGYQAGHAKGHRAGYDEAGPALIAAMQALVTHTSARDFVHALEVLHRFTHPPVEDIETICTEVREGGR